MRARGLALLEVIISTGILFSVMLILLNLATTSLWGSKEGGERLTAEAQAASLLERYRTTPFGAYAPGQTIAGPAYVEDGTEYTTTLAVRTVDSVSPDNLRLLTVTVSWTSKRGAREVVLSSYAAPLLR